jgi:hypothetical protein
MPSSPVLVHLPETHQLTTPHPKFHPDSIRVHAPTVAKITA